MKLTADEVACHLLLHPEALETALPEEIAALNDYVEHRRWKGLHHHDRRKYRLLRKAAEYPRIRNLPQSEREPFRKWLYGQTTPGLSDEDGKFLPTSEQDSYYISDYCSWKWGFERRQARWPKTEAQPMKTVSYKADLFKNLEDPEFAANYISQARTTGDKLTLRLALKDVAQAKRRRKK